MGGRRHLWLVLLLLGTLAGPTGLAAAEVPAPPTPSSSFVPGKVILEWAPGVSRAEKGAVRREAEVAYESDLGDTSFQLVGVDPGQTVAGAIEELKAHRAVALAERDSYAHTTSIPNDPLFAEQWALQNTGAGIDGFSGAIAGADIKATGAWDRTVGSPNTVIADIDSGYRFNGPDLGPVAWENSGEIPGNGIDDDGNGFVDDVHGYDFVGSSVESPTQDSDPTDDDLLDGGHGVHTAGIIGAAGNNGVGITGVAQNVRIMPLRVCVGDTCPVSSVIAAINYAGKNGARVANLSLTTTTRSQAMFEALAEQRETLFVIAAGNDAQNNDDVPHYPCSFQTGSPLLGEEENVICVAATDQADGLASFSDWGKESVDLGAPGTQILSTFPAPDTLASDDFGQDDFESKWETSAAGGGFARTNEAPLTSFGISDSPGATPVANQIRSSTLRKQFVVPAEDSNCVLSGADGVTLSGGTASLIVFKNGVSAFTFSLPNTTGGQMANFKTTPMEGLAGSSVTFRVRYIAGASPTPVSGLWLDDLKFRCAQPLSTPPSYEFLNGTSMAAPQVSGAAALILSRKPSVSTEEVRDALIESADPDSSLAGKTANGGGRLDVARALEFLEPPAPQLSGTDPASPAEVAEPLIVGSAMPGTEVRIFAAPECQGGPVAQGTAAELASPGLKIEVPVEGETTIEFSAKVRTGVGESPCSAPLSYTNSTDVTPPDAPKLTHVDPQSPARNAHPHVLGSAEPGSTVLIYDGFGACEGKLVGSGTAEELASPGIEVTVPANMLDGFSASATDAAGNVSGCLAAGLQYLDDEDPPEPPLLSTSPASPASFGEPLIIFSDEEGAQITIFEGAGCAGPVLATRTFVHDSEGTLIKVPPGSTAQFSATATDLAGNISACSAPLSYTNTTPLSVEPPPPALCTVPKLAGKTLAQAKKALKTAHCTLGKVTKPNGRNGSLAALVVKSSNPKAGSVTPGRVSLRLGPKPKHHR